MIIMLMIMCIRVFNIVDGFVLFMSKLLHCSLINQLAFTSYAD